MQTLFRLHKYFAAGLHLAANFNQPDDPQGVDTEVFMMLMVGAEGRVILPLGKLDVWFGTAMGYGRFMWNGEEGHSDFRFWVNSFAAAFGSGVDYRLRERILVGLNMYQYWLVGRKLCYKDSDDKGCEKLNSDVRSRLGGWWALGLTLTYLVPY